MFAFVSVDQELVPAGGCSPRRLMRFCIEQQIDSQLGENIHLPSEPLPQIHMDNQLLHSMALSYQ